MESKERMSRVRRVARGERFTPATVDLTDVTAIGAVFDAIAVQFGGVDALVNNAGTCLMANVPEIPAPELDRQMAINVSPAFHCYQRAVPLMRGRPGVKKIVNISSNGAYNFDVFDPPHDRASKAAMDTLTTDLARRDARERIAAWVSFLIPPAGDICSGNVIVLNQGRDVR